VSNNAGNAETGIALLLKARRVRKVDLLLPAADRLVALRQALQGEGVELELVPQGNLAERIRAAGARHRRFLHADRIRNAAREGKETRNIAGRDDVLEYPSAPISRW
jgi:3-oxoadipate CoA-transferase alpha subunit